jgi:lysozyme
MRTSKEGLDFIKVVEEGDLDRLDRIPPPKLRAYNDGVGVWTIGWGCTHGVHEGMTITLAEAETMFADEMVRPEKAVNKNVRVPLTQRQFDILVSFTYNCGEGALASSTLLKRLNAGDYAAVPSELMKWNHGGGKVMSGLTARRKLEGARWRAGSGHEAVAEAPAHVEAPAPVAAPRLGLLGRLKVRVKSFFYG